MPFTRERRQTMDFFHVSWNRLKGRISKTSPAIRTQFWDGAIAVVLCFLAQVLICGFRLVTVKINNFPASIAAMLAVAVVMMALSWLVKSVDRVYQSYFRGPVRAVLSPPRDPAD